MSSRTTKQDSWEKRIARANELASQYVFAAEVLHFYMAIARFQEVVSGEIARSGIQGGLRSGGPSPGGPGSGGPGSVIETFARPLQPEATGQFEQFLLVVERNGPDSLCEAASELRDDGQDSHFQLLAAFWNATGTAALPAGPHDFFARAYLQPYAEYIRSQLTLQGSGPAPYVCPFCKRKPGHGILRPLGDGGLRSLVCSFCLAEWVFRRLVCPGCGEENHAKLAVYTAEELKHVRVETCDSCRTYIKTVDLTKSGRAEPVVDEIASMPLDLWAKKQGYTKLQINLMQI